MVRAGWGFFTQCSSSPLIFQPPTHPKDLYGFTVCLVFFLFVFLCIYSNPAVSWKMIGCGHYSSSISILKCIESKGFRHGWWVTCTSPVQTGDHLTACFHLLFRVFTAVTMATIPIKGSALIITMVFPVYMMSIGRL